MFVPKRLEQSSNTLAPGDTPYRIESAAAVGAFIAVTAGLRSPLLLDRVELHEHLRRPPQHTAYRGYRDIRGKAQARKAFQHSVEHYSNLGSGQVQSQADMRAASEGDMTILAAIQREFMGIFELARVTIRAAYAQENDAPGWDLRAIDGD